MKRTLLLVFLVLLSFGALYGQSKVYSYEDVGKDNARIAKFSGTEVSSYKSDKSLKTAIRKHVFIGEPWRDSIAFYAVLEGYYYNKKDVVSYIRSHLHILTYCKQNLTNHDFGVRLVKVGEAYFSLGNYMLAKEFFTQALAYEIDDVKPYVHSQIGMAYMNLNELESSVESYGRAADLTINMGDKVSHTNSLGYVHFLAKNFKDSKRSYRRALQLYDEHHKTVDSIQYYILMSNMASLHFALGDRQKGYAYLDTIFATDYCKPLPWFVVEVTDKYVKACLADGDCAKARYFLDIMAEALRSHKEISMEINYLSAEQGWHLSCGNVAEARRVTEELAQLRDSVGRERMRMLSSVELIQRNMFEDRLALVETNLDLTQNNQTILKESNYRLRILFIILGILSLAAILFLWIYLRARQRRQKRKEDFLRLQEDLLLEKEKTAELNFKMEEQEIERRRLELVQILSNIDLNNSLNEELLFKIGVLKSKAGEEIREELNQLHQFVHSQSKSNSIHELIEKNPDLLTGDFKSRVEARFSDLSTSELQLVMFIRVGLSTKEMAQLKSVEPSTIRIYKHRLKTKFDLSKEQDLEAFIAEI